MTELAGNLTSPMWIGDRIYYLSDAEGVGNLYSCRPDGSDAAPAHRPRRLLRAPCADRRQAHRLPMRRRGLAVRSGGATATARIDIETPSHRTQAARKFVAAADHLGGDRRASGRSQPGGRRARQAVHVRALGRRGAPAWRCRRRPLPAWAVAGRRHDARRRRRRLGRGARRRVRRSDGERTLPWDVGRVIALRAAPRGSRDRARQPSQRGADRRPRPRHAAR